MPTRYDLLDTRTWGTRKPRLDPPPPPAEPPGHTVVFLDRSKRGWGRPRPVQLDCLPAVWTKLEPVPEGLIKRTWVREPGPADGCVYREIAPALFTPTAYKPGGGVKQGKPKAEPEPEEWAE